MHLNVNEYTGATFLKACMRAFSTTLTNIDKMLLIGYLLLILYYLFRGTRRERSFFVFQPIILVITAINPWMASILVEKVGLADRFYRFFWLLPIGIVYGYFISNLVMDKQKKHKNQVVLIVLIGLLILSGKSVVDKTGELFTGANPNTGMEKVDNRYKVQDDVLVAGAAIDEDKNDVAKKVNVLFDYMTYIEMRTYDPSLIPVLQGADRGTWNGVGVVQSQLDEAVEACDWISIENIMFNAIIVDPSGSLNLESSVLLRALHETNTNYVILQKNNGSYNLWMTVGTIIAESDNYVTLKVE